MFLDRLICKLFGHAPVPINPTLCSRCRDAIVALIAPLPQRGPILPWWGLGPPPGWREPTFERGRQGHVEYRAAAARIYQRNGGV